MLIVNVFALEVALVLCYCIYNIVYHVYFVFTRLFCMSVQAETIYLCLELQNLCFCLDQIIFEKGLFKSQWNFYLDK